MATKKAIVNKFTKEELEGLSNEELMAKVYDDEINEDYCYDGSCYAVILSSDFEAVDIVCEECGNRMTKEPPSCATGSNKYIKIPHACDECGSKKIRLGRIKTRLRYEHIGLDTVASMIKWAISSRINEKMKEPIERLRTEKCEAESEARLLRSDVAQLKNLKAEMAEENARLKQEIAELESSQDEDAEPVRDEGND